MNGFGPPDTTDNRRRRSSRDFSHRCRKMSHLRFSAAAHRAGCRFEDARTTHRKSRRSTLLSHSHVISAVQSPPRPSFLPRLYISPMRRNADPSRIPMALSAHHADWIRGDRHGHGGAAPIIIIGKRNDRHAANRTRSFTAAGAGTLNRCDRAGRRTLRGLPTGKPQPSPKLSSRSRHRQ